MSVSNIVQEHRGLAKVHSVCAEMDAIWRATGASDLGIDGQVEFLEAGKAVSTGFLVAVQVKSGPSYFKQMRGSLVEFHPKPKHRQYWSRLTLPVVLVLHNPDNDVTIYARVKPQLLHDGPILLSFNDKFDAHVRDKLLGAAAEELTLTPPGDVLRDFCKATYTVDSGIEITGIHLLLASTDPHYHYFELRMCRLIELIQLIENQSGCNLGTSTYEFLHRCVLKVWHHELTDPFIGDFEEMWYNQTMVPDIGVPLTPKGTNVLEHLWSNLDVYLSIDGLSDRFKSATELGQAICFDAQSASARLDASDRLGEVPR